MKVLKAKTLLPNKTILAISDLTYNNYSERYNAILTRGVENIKSIMNQPIEVFKHKINDRPRVGVGGRPYIEKKYSVIRGSQRVVKAKRLGYTHIEAIINE